MKKIPRAVFILFSSILLFAIAFFFWGSSGWVDPEDYDQIITYSAEAPLKDTLTVMTYNLGYLSGMTNNLPLERSDSLFSINMFHTKMFLKDRSTDIIGFQEIDFDSDRSKNQNQLDTFGISQVYHQGYASVNWDKRYVPFPYWPVDLHFGKMKSGQALLSKYPIENTESVILERPIEAPFYYRAFYLDRLVQIADVRIGKITVKLLNVHLESFYPETRGRQAHVVKGLFEKYSGEMPVLLIGDFNSEAPWANEADEAMRTILSADYISSAVDQEQYESDLENLFTFSSGDPHKKIDFILYNCNFIKKIDSYVVSAVGEISDHLPVVMRFVFKSENELMFTE